MLLIFFLFSGRFLRHHTNTRSFKGLPGKAPVLAVNQSENSDIRIPPMNAQGAGREAQLGRSAHFSRDISMPSDSSMHFQQQQQPYECSLCGKGYATLSGLTLHMETHSGKSYVCPVCDAKFTQRGTMKRHLKSIHRCQQCTECEGVFHCGPEFDQHVLSHV